MSSAKKTKVIGDSSSDEEDSISQKQKTASGRNRNETSKKQDAKPVKTKCIGDVDSEDEKDANQKNQANNIGVNQSQNKPSVLSDSASAEGEKQILNNKLSNANKGKKIGDSSSSDDEGIIGGSKSKTDSNAAIKPEVNSAPKNQPSVALKDNKGIPDHKEGNNLKSEDHKKQDNNHNTETKTAKSKVIGDSSSDDEEKPAPQQSQNLRANLAGNLVSKINAGIVSKSSVQSQQKVDSQKQSESKLNENRAQNKPSEPASHQKEVVPKPKLVIGEFSSDEDEPSKKQEVVKVSAAKVKNIGDSSSDEETYSSGQRADASKTSVRQNSKKPDDFDRSNLEEAKTNKPGSSKDEETSNKNQPRDTAGITDDYK